MGIFLWWLTIGSSREEKSLICLVFFRLVAQVERYRVRAKAQHSWRRAKASGKWQQQVDGWWLRCHTLTHTRTRINICGQVVEGPINRPLHEGRLGHRLGGKGRRSRSMYSPNSESKPQASQIMKLTPTEPVRTSKPEGDTNIPDPVNRNRIKTEWEFESSHCFAIGKSTAAQGGSKEEGGGGEVLRIMLSAVGTAASLRQTSVLIH